MPIVNRDELASGDAGIEVRLELFDGTELKYKTEKDMHTCKPQSPNKSIYRKLT